MRDKRLGFFGIFCDWQPRQISQCLFNCDTPFGPGGAQNGAAGNKDIIHIWAHKLLIMAYPVAQQTLGPIAVNSMTKCFFCRDQTVSGVVRKLCVFCPNQTECTSCDWVCFGHQKIIMVLYCISHTGHNSRLYG